MLKTFSTILDTQLFKNTIVGVILLNAAILGLMTIPGLDPSMLALLDWLDHACLVVFCIELSMKLAVLRLGFFRDGWNIFDFVVVGIALAPASGPLSVLRAMRVLRLMRLVSAFPSMRRVIAGMFGSIPGVASVAGILLVIFYVAAIMAIGFFREIDPEKFGGLGPTFFTLFQLMTTEGWPTIARAMMEKMPHAWLFFIPFIVMTTFTTLNLVFGIVVTAMEEAKEEEAREDMAAQGIVISDESNEVRLAVIENQVKDAARELESLQKSLDRLLEKQSIARLKLESAEK
ncbi:MAG TPA: ion transporter [Rhodocyclaceae bacterium]|nr:ion transporter [Rhodocyclaceae bacterium]